MNPASLGPLRVAVWTSLMLGAMGGCGSTGPNGNPPLPSEACIGQPVTQLAVGQHAVLDPAATSGCLRIPIADASGAQHLLVLASTNGTRSSSGIEGTYLLRASQPVPAAGPSAAPSSPAPSPTGSFALPQETGLLGGPPRSPAAAEFDGALRERERRLLSDPRYQRRPVAAPAGVIGPAPPLGDLRTFKACANLLCSSFANVTATARFIGEHLAIYLDNNAPANDPLTNADLAELGAAFDAYHYPIDTTAFGRESDIDGNGVVIMLMTKAVNDLTPDCDKGRVVGFFFGGDLLVGPNSNRAEIFYTLVPAPATSGCTVVTRRMAINNLKPTLIHEFQHMISFNQHALVRTGLSEDTWLNEALSHLAEELGGRLIPASECTLLGFPSCRSQYSSGNIINGYDYLKDTDTNYVFFPNATPGNLPERGAGWLFLRWALDQFATDTISGTPTTRALVQTSATGSANLVAATGGSLSALVPQWLMALYLDDGPDLPEEPTGRLRYKSWGLRAIWSNPENFSGGFPLVPPSITGTFSKSGALKAGSGQHFLLVQPALGAPLDLQVLRSAAGAQLSPDLQARFGIVRIR